MFQVNSPVSLRTVFRERPLRRFGARFAELDFGGETCASLGYSDGSLVCQSDCTLDLTGCYGVCGDLEDDGSFRYVAGYEVSKSDDLPAGMVSWEIPEQTYAVFPCTLSSWALSISSVKYTVP